MKLESVEKMANELIEIYLSIDGLRDFYGKNSFPIRFKNDDDNIIDYLTEDWKFKFHDSREYIGHTNYDDATISIATAYAKSHSKATIYDALMHEIAHALCPKAGHNYIWYEICRRLGQTPFEQILWGFPMKGSAGDAFISNTEWSDIKANSKLSAEEKAQKFIMMSFEDYASGWKGKKIVGTDFYYMINGCPELPNDYQFNQKFVTKVIKENFPDWSFYWIKDKTPLSQEEREKVKCHLDDEIRRQKKYKQYFFIKKLLLRDIKSFKDVSHEKALQVIREDYSDLTIEGDRIKINRYRKNSK